MSRSDSNCTWSVISTHVISVFVQTGAKLLPHPSTSSIRRSQPWICILLDQVTQRQRGDNEDYKNKFDSKYFSLIQCNQNNRKKHNTPIPPCCSCGVIQVSGSPNIQFRQFFSVVFYYWRIGHHLLELYQIWLQYCSPLRLQKGFVDSHTFQVNYPFNAAWFNASLVKNVLSQCPLWPLCGSKPGFIVLFIKQ